MTFRQILLIVTGVVTFLSQDVTAQDSWHASLVGVGASQTLDTYLSPEKYSGTEIRVLSQTHRQWRKHSQWSSQSSLMGAFLYAEQRAENSNEMGGMLTYDYAILHAWQLRENWRIEAGGQAETAVGFLYNTRNTNNPAQARAYLHIAPDVATTWHFPVFRKQCALRYEITIPLLGVLFSPNYGQSYYEIFTRGNYDHNAVFTTPFNAPTLRHQLTVDIPIKKMALRIGYLGDYQQAEVNNLKYHTYSHLLLIGLVRPLYR
jgi:hypothetical protein